MPRFNDGGVNIKLEKGDIILMGNPTQYGEILAENLLVEDITKANLQTLISASELVRGKFYRITNAVSSTLSLLVQGLTANTICDYAYNTANGELVAYNITTDLASVPFSSAYVPYTGATTDVNLGANDITANAIIKSGGTSAQFLKADGSVDSTDYYSTNSEVTSQPLTGLSVSGSAIVSTDSILTALGKAQNQINAVVGSVNFQGVWNASTNSPSLASGVGTKGYYYIVTVAGSTNLNGITDWKLGDWAIYDGTAWQKVDNTDAVVSVNGYTGIVTLAKADIGLGNVENTTLSTWAGSGNITTLGTITSGVIGDSVITSAANWNTAYTNRITSLTTTGSSGAATLISNVLNIPNYTLAGLGGVPYTGATTNVNLGTHSLTASDLVINHASGSGVAASITKSGSGEALTVVKSSGLGNAASITGGVTLLSELHLTTDLADAYISSASTWNAKIGGSGTTGYIPKFTGSGTIGDSNVSEASNVLGVGLTPSTFNSGSFGTNTTVVEISQLGSFIGAGSGALILGNNFYSNATDYLYARTGFGATSYQMNTSLASHIWYNAPSGTAGGVITFAETMKLTATELITFGATDTGEAHIFGGSARVNGDFDVRDSNVYFGAVKGYTYIIDDQINSYYSADSNEKLNINYYGYNGGATRSRSLEIFDGKTNSILLLNGVTGAATFSSSVNAASFRTVSGGVLALNRPDNGANSEIFTNASNELILSTATGGQFKVKSTGVVNIASIPTSSSGLSAGDIWSDGGTLKIV